MDSGRPIIAGIFVGGRGRRLGGRPKGLLVTPSGQTVLASLRSALTQASIPHVLVGAHAAYAAEGLETLEDDPRAEGPLAGLLALLERAGGGLAVAVACDMPFVSAASLRRLADEAARRGAPVLAARRDGRWEPFFAVYDAARVLPVAVAAATRGERRLQALLDESGAEEHVLDASEERALVDWDTPADLARDGEPPR